MAVHSRTSTSCEAKDDPAAQFVVVGLAASPGQRYSLSRTEPLPPLPPPPLVPVPVLPFEVDPDPLALLEAEATPLPALPLEDEAELPIEPPPPGRTVLVLRPQ